MKYTFLILHYINSDETKNCVKSIVNKIKQKNYNILIVDNGSNNGTGEELQLLYKKNKNIEVIINNENLGFANGNNVGIRYIRRKYKSDYIIMINSDTLITQENMLDLIEKKYNKYKFAVLGPNITCNNKPSNPVLSPIHNLKDLRKTSSMLKRKMYLNRYGLELLNILIDKIKHKFRRKNKEKYSNKEIVLSGNMQLHGSALVFSKEYFKHYDGLFKGTFLYMEETILRYYCQGKELIMLYSPEIEIIHNEAKSTKMLYKNYVKRHAFYYRNAYNSSLKIMDFIKNDDMIIWK